MSRTGPIVAALASLALVSLLVYGMVDKSGANTLDTAVARGETPPAPSAELPPLVKGGPTSVAELRGKPVLVNFWASWCEPCKAEAPVVERAHRKLQRLGGTVLGVTVDDASGASLAFMRTFKMTFPSVRDVDDKMEKAYRTTGVPETFVINAAGRIVAINHGPIDDRFVDQALARAAR